MEPATITKLRVTSNSLIIEEKLPGIFNIRIQKFIFWYQETKGLTESDWNNVVKILKKKYFFWSCQCRSRYLLSQGRRRLRPRWPFWIRRWRSCSWSSPDRCHRLTCRPLEPDTEKLELWRSILFSILVWEKIQIEGEVWLKNVLIT